jgi:hypothetical protein
MRVSRDLADLTEISKCRKTIFAMTRQKRAKLPPGMHWGSRTPFILFNWRDALGKQHHQSTGTTDPHEALLFKLKFLEEREQNAGEVEAEAAEDLGKLPTQASR